MKIYFEDDLGLESCTVWYKVGCASFCVGTIGWDADHESMVFRHDGRLEVIPYGVLGAILDKMREMDWRAGRFNKVIAKEKDD